VPGRYRKQNLPCCGYEVDDVSSIYQKDAVPEPGDFSICLNCGSWLRFTEDAATLRTIEVSDWLELDDDNRNHMSRITKEIHKRGLLRKGGVDAN